MTVDHNLAGILDLLMFCETIVGHKNIYLGAVVLLKFSLACFIRSKIDLTLGMTMERSRDKSFSTNVCSLTLYPVRQMAVFPRRQIKTLCQCTIYHLHATDQLIF